MKRTPIGTDLSGPSSLLSEQEEEIEIEAEADIEVDSIGAQQLEYAELNKALRIQYIGLSAKIDSNNAAGKTKSTESLELQRAQVMERFCSINTGLVHAASRKFSKLGDSAEYVQCGWVGFLKAFKSWNPELGTFPTYARLFIKRALLEGVASNEFSQLSNHEFGDRVAVRAAVVELREILGRSPSDNEVASHTGLTAGSINRIRAPKAIQLDAPVSSDSTETIGSTLSLEASSDVETTSPLASLSKLCSPRELWVLLSLNGLSGATPMNIVEIGNSLGIGRNIINRDKERYLESMREYAASNDLSLHQ